MTELESRATYGLLSKTILNTLASEDISSEAIFIFSLHMQWGIIMGHPQTHKSAIAEEMLKRLTERILKEKKQTQTDFKKVFIDNRDNFLKIFKQISIHPIKPGHAWYTTWKEHCNRLLSNEPTPETCFQLFLILKDCMDVKHEDFLLSITVIYETLLYATATT
jgi:hypothetical protein